MIPETPPLSGQAQLEAENARLRRELRYYRYRLYYSRYRRSGRTDSEDELSDSEVGDSLRVSFLYYYIGNKLFLSLYKHYPAINIKYFK